NITSDVRNGTLPSGAVGFPLLNDNTTQYFPKSPGPDDNFDLTFPTTGSYSDLRMTTSGALVMALGTDAITGSPTVDANNAVYYCANPTSNKPVWYIGDANTNDGGDLAHATYGNNKNGSVSGQVNSGTPGGAKPFPTTFSVNFGPPVVAPSIRNGNIKI